MKLNIEYGKWLNTMPWDYFTTLSYKWDVKAKQCRRVMDNLTLVNRNVDNDIDRQGSYSVITFFSTEPSSNISMIGVFV